MLGQMDIPACFGNKRFTGSNPVIYTNFKFKDMSDNKTTTSSGIGFFGLLAILFIALKLTGVITWSWLWVLAPIWITFVIVVFILIITNK